MDSQDYIRSKVDQLVIERGSLRAAASLLGTSPGYLSRVRSGEKGASDELLDRLGVQRIILLAPVVVPWYSSPRKSPSKRRKKMDLAELGALADLYHETRQQRLEADRVVANLKSEENKLKQALIDALKVRDLSAIGGQVIIARRVPKKRAVAQDWSKIYDYIYRTRAMDVLEKRLLQSGIQARWDDGIEVPGVGVFEYDELSTSKVPK